MEKHETKIERLKKITEVIKTDLIVKKRIGSIQQTSTVGHHRQGKSMCRSSFLFLCFFCVSYVSYVSFVSLVSFVLFVTFLYPPSSMLHLRLTNAYQERHSIVLSTHSVSFCTRFLTHLFFFSLSPLLPLRLFALPSFLSLYYF